MMLPTSPRLIETFEALVEEKGEEEEELGGKEKVDIPSLLQPENPHKLMYSLQIVEYLSKPMRYVFFYFMI